MPCLHLSPQARELCPTLVSLYPTVAVKPMGIHGVLLFTMGEIIRHCCAGTVLLLTRRILRWHLALKISSPLLTRLSATAKLCWRYEPLALIFFPPESESLLGYCEAGWANLSRWDWTRPRCSRSRWCRRTATSWECNGCSGTWTDRRGSCGYLQPTIEQPLDQPINLSVNKSARQ